MSTEVERGGFAGALRGWRRVSQLELALRANTTQRHVSFIESGRSLPGRGMVLRLAESLQVPLRERNALLLAAGYAPAYEETRFDDPKLDTVRTALERILKGHLPYPAVITDRHGDLVSSNDAFWDLTRGAAPDLLSEPLNVGRLLLHPRGMAPRILNLDEWAWHMINAVRDEAARNPNERLEALLSERTGPSARMATGPPVSFGPRGQVRPPRALRRPARRSAGRGVAVPIHGEQRGWPLALQRFWGSPSSGSCCSPFAALRA